MVYSRLKRIADASGYVGELLIGRLGITLHTRIEHRQNVAPRFIFEVSAWIIKR